MDDFTFCGRHIRSFGAEAAFGASMRMGGKAVRGEYALPGGGSALLGDTVWQPTQRSVVILPLPGVDADERWAREILCWLQAGRGELVTDNHPDVMRIASFDADGVFGTQRWPAGCIEISMTLHPLAYASSSARGETDAEDGVEAVVPLALRSALRTPLYARIECTKGEITAATIAAGSKTLVLPNLRLAPGDVLEYDAGQILGDPVDLRVNGETDFSPAQGGVWAALDYDPAKDVIRVTLTGGAAHVTARARGRFQT